MKRDEPLMHHSPGSANSEDPADFSLSRAQTLAPLIFAPPAICGFWPNVARSVIVARVGTRLMLAVWCLTLLSACGNTAPLVDVMSVHLGASEKSLRKSKDSFAFDPNGHFGDKVQYDSRLPDEFGGAYAVHCRSGHCFGIEVKYPHSIAAATAHKVLNRLIQTVAGKQTGHDNDDLRHGDADRPSEYFYFANKVRAELIYNAGTQDQVDELNAWTE